MKILFVSSGNTRFGISPITESQGKSLKKNDVIVEYFLITGRGLKSYLRSIFKLRTFLKTRHYDLIHAHFSLSGITASLSFPKQPIVVSLMGSDVHSKNLNKKILKIFSRLSWKNIIVKSKEMVGMLDVKCHVIPNGVDFDLFKPEKKELARKKLGLQQKKYILFIGDPARKEKNFPLTKQAVTSINNPQIELLNIYKTEHTEIPLYLNAADVLVMTSLWEGSPNVIKEAMACNCPVVSTDVGDVREIIDSVNGCYIADYNTIDVAQKIKMSLQFNKRTNGREKIAYLDSNNIAKKLIRVYQETLQL